MYSLWRMSRLPTNEEKVDAQGSRDKPRLAGINSLGVKRICYFALFVA
jgi:hypothetical protein